MANQNKIVLNILAKNKNDIPEANNLFMINKGSSRIISSLNNHSENSENNTVNSKNTNIKKGKGSSSGEEKKTSLKKKEIEFKPENHKKKDSSTQFKKYAKLSKDKSKDGKKNNTSTSTYGSKIQTKNYSNIKKK